MSIKAILMALFGASTGKDGMWDFLGKRGADKSRIEREKQWHEGTLLLIKALKPGMVLRESGPDWTREIIMPGAALSGVLVTAVDPTPASPSIAPAQGERQQPPSLSAGPVDDSD